MKVFKIYWKIQLFLANLKKKNEKRLLTTSKAKLVRWLHLHSGGSVLVSKQQPSSSHAELSSLQYTQYVTFLRACTKLINSVSIVLVSLFLCYDNFLKVHKVFISMCYNVKILSRTTATIFCKYYSIYIAIKQGIISVG